MIIKLGKNYLNTDHINLIRIQDGAGGRAAYIYGEDTRNHIYFTNNQDEVAAIIIIYDKITVRDMIKHNSPFTEETPNIVVADWLEDQNKTAAAKLFRELE